MALRTELPPPAPETMPVMSRLCFWKKPFSSAMPYGAPEGSFLYWVTRRSAALTGQVDPSPIATIRMMLLGFISMSLPEITSAPRGACRDRPSVTRAAAAVYWNIDAGACRLQQEQRIKDSDLEHRSRICVQPKYTQSSWGRSARLCVQTETKQARPARDRRDGRSCVLTPAGYRRP